MLDEQRSELGVGHLRDGIRRHLARLQELHHGRALRLEIVLQTERRLLHHVLRHRRREADTRVDEELQISGAETFSDDAPASATAVALSRQDRRLESGDIAELHELALEIEDLLVQRGPRVRRGALSERRDPLALRVISDALLHVAREEAGSTA